jgi:uncharacterized membrane protein (UPF0127 family)
MKRNLSILIVAALILTACRTQQPVVTGMNSSDILVKDTIVHAWLAETVPQQIKGLGGTASLDWDQGMLFPFPNKSKRVFWMKDMLIPIDIIWLSDTTIVGIEKKVPQPIAGENNTHLPTYSSPDMVNYVLEVKAGFADKFGLKVGDIVRIDK